MMRPNDRPVETPFNWYTFMQKLFLIPLRTAQYIWKWIRKLVLCWGPFFGIALIIIGTMIFVGACISNAMEKKKTRDKENTYFVKVCTDRSRVVVKEKTKYNETSPYHREYRVQILKKYSRSSGGTDEEWYTIHRTGSKKAAMNSCDDAKRGK